MRKRGFLLSIIVLTTLFLIINAQEAVACPNDVHPCLLFGPGDVPAIKERLGITGNNPVTEAQEAYNQMQSSCSTTASWTEANPPDYIAYEEECAFKCLMQDQNAPNACAGATHLLNSWAQSPTISSFPLNANFLSSIAIAYDFMASVPEAQGGLSQTEKTQIISKMIDWTKIYGGAWPSTHQQASSNGFYAPAASTALASTILYQNSLVSQTSTSNKQYYDTDPEVLAHLTATKNMLKNGNADFYTSGIRSEGWSYPGHGPDKMPAAILAITRTMPAETELDLAGPAIQHPYFNSYALLADRYTYQADTTEHPYNFVGRKIIFDMWKYIGLLYDNGETEKAKFAQKQYEHIWNDLQNNGAYNEAFSKTYSRYLGKALWYRQDISSQATNYDYNEHAKPSEYFRSNKNLNWGSSTQQFTPEHAELGQGGELVMHSPKIPTGQILSGTNQLGTQIFIIGEQNVHQSDYEDGTIVMNMKKGTGPTYTPLMSRGYAAGAEVYLSDYNSIFRPSSIDPTKSALKSTNTAYGFTTQKARTKALTTGRRITYHHSDHSEIWGLTTADRTFFFIPDEEQPAMYFLDEAYKQGLDLTQGFKTQNQVSVNSQNDQMTQTLSSSQGIRLKWKYYYTTSPLTFYTNTPTTNIQGNYYQRVQQSASGGQKQRWFYALHPEFSNTQVVLTETKLQVSGGYGAKIVRTDGTHYILFRHDTSNTMSLNDATNAPEITIPSTTAKAIILIDDGSDGSINAYSVGEVSGTLTLTYSGNNINLVSVNTPETISLSMGKGLHYSQNNIYDDTQTALPPQDLTAYLPTNGLNNGYGTPQTKEATWENHNGKTELTENFDYTITGNTLTIGTGTTPTCSVTCGTNHVQSSSCTGTNCNFVCDLGWSDCNGIGSDGCETSISTTSSCGTCNNQCSYNNAQATCNLAGQTYSCALGTCNTNYANCNNFQGDGCETSTTTITNCGTCGNTCSYPNAQSLCSQQTCTIGTCNNGYWDNNNDPSDGCEYGICQQTNNGNELCEDNLDNDCDGKIDCEDSDCNTSPLCQTPVINSISPGTLIESGTNTIIISGTGLNTLSNVAFYNLIGYQNGKWAESTSYNAQQQELTATFSGTCPECTVGTIYARVFNNQNDPAYASNQQGFYLTSPTPTLTSLSSPTYQNNQPIQIIITGNNFKPQQGAFEGTSVLTSLNGGNQNQELQPTTVEYVSNSQLKLNLPAGTAPGSYELQLQNPGEPDYEKSTNTEIFTIINYCPPGSTPPTLTSINPNPLLNRGTINLEIIGSDFQQGAGIVIGTLTIPMNYENAGKLALTGLPVEGLTIGTIPVTVINPDSCTSSQTVNLEITQDTPAITSLNPEELLPEGGTVTITGTGYYTNINPQTKSKLGILIRDGNAGIQYSPGTTNEVIEFAELTGTYTVDSQTQITLILPLVPIGNYELVVQNQEEIQSNSLFLAVQENSGSTSSTSSGSSSSSSSGGSSSSSSSGSSGSGIEQIQGDPSVKPQCINGEDDDGDGLTDFPADPGCESNLDDDEYNEIINIGGGEGQNLTSTQKTIKAIALWTSLIIILAVAILLTLKITINKIHEKKIVGVKNSPQEYEGSGQTHVLG